MSNNSLNDHYIGMLNKFLARNSQFTEKKSVEDLITAISTASSLQELLDAVKKVPTAPQLSESSSHSPTFFLEPDKISKWVKQLETAVTNYPIAQTAVNKIEQCLKQSPEQSLKLSPEQSLTITPLINILKHILVDKPKLQLNDKIISLVILLGLSTPTFSELIQFIASRTHVDSKRTEIPSGSFLQPKSTMTDSVRQEQLDSNYKHCSQLLHNVANSYDEKNKLCVNANSLLQTALLIYKDSLEEQMKPSADVRSSSKPILSCEETKYEPQEGSSWNSCRLF